MKRRRISSALAGIAVSCAVGAALWPHAREALVLLWSQDEPADLADVQINSALANNQKIVAGNIDEALAKGDADLAKSFVELARAKNIALPEELTRRVAEAVAEENSTSHFPKPFATAFITGTADDV